MQNARDATIGPKADNGEAATRERAAMLNVDDVAAMLRCSVRTVYRLADSGRMPRPVKLGALVRWSREVVEGWIADGCPRCERRRADRAR
jgi:excisionase family DNA binding protein